MDNSKFRNSEGKLDIWHDIQCDDTAIKEAYPNIFSTARMQEAVIAGLLVLSNGVPQWNITSFRDTQDREVDAVLLK